MYFASWEEAWVMGGHGPFVWSAIGMTLVVLLWLVLREVLRQQLFFRRERRRQLLADRVADTAGKD